MALGHFFLSSQAEAFVDQYCILIKSTRADKPFLIIQFIWNIPLIAMRSNYVLYNVFITELDFYYFIFIEFVLFSIEQDVFLPFNISLLLF